MSGFPTFSPVRPLGQYATLSLALFLAGCATVDLKPFVEFSFSVQLLREGNTAHIAAAVDSSRSKLLVAVKNGQISPADLQLTFEGPFGTTYGASDDEPLFIKEQRFGQALAMLNDAVGSYAQSLVMLAGGAKEGDILPSQQQFDRMTKDVNLNAMAFARTLRFDIAPMRGALLSTTAVRLFQAFIETQRRDALADAIAEVQPNIEAYAAATEQAIQFIAEGIETDYQVEFLTLATASPADARPILALNERTQHKLAELEALSSSYQRLPQAHADLVRAASSRPGALVGLTAFNQEAQRLAALARTLAKTNAKAATPRMSR